MSETFDVKQQVREFYDQVGWQEVSQGVYENALYEDLRPVSSEYIHRCHMRVMRHLKPSGHYLLDAGSGPVQYPEYVEYSRNFQRRICADISITALQEARNKLADHGLYVVADIANLPFNSEQFDGVVSLHTIHHLPKEEHLPAYQELYRVLNSGERAVVVVGWEKPLLIKIFNAPHRLRKWWQDTCYRIIGSKRKSQKIRQPKPSKGTFHEKYDAKWLKGQLENKVPIEILVWRSIGVRTLRIYFHEALGGRLWLELLYKLEERFPFFFGENGSYPLIVIYKSIRPTPVSRDQRVI
jgi:ubiquinone/menaquinone biosynthesis C-methylase UbiE